MKFYKDRENNNIIVYNENKFFFDHKTILT